MESDGIARDGIRRGDVVVVTGGGGVWPGLLPALRARRRQGGDLGSRCQARRGNLGKVKAEGGEAQFFKVDLSQTSGDR